MVFGQSLKPSSDIVELLDFTQDRFKSHGQTALSLKPKMEELQMDWLRSEDLKEVNLGTAPIIMIAVRRSGLRSKLLYIGRAVLESWG
jgi:hypothetical protein